MGGILPSPFLRLPWLLLLSLQVSAVILSAAKDPEEFHSSQPLEPFSSYLPLPLSPQLPLPLPLAIALSLTQEPSFRPKLLAASWPQAQSKDLRFYFAPAFYPIVPVN
jgi:hypothetical protein